MSMLVVTIQNLTENILVVPSISDTVIKNSLPDNIRGGRLFCWEKIHKPKKEGGGKLLPGACKL